MTLVTYTINLIILLLAFQRLAHDYNPVFSSYSNAINLNKESSVLKPFEKDFDIAFGLKNKDNTGVIDPDPRYGRFVAEYVKKNMTDFTEEEVELPIHKC